MLRSSGKSSFKRSEICCGLQDATHRRSWRRGLLRPFHGPVAGPATCVSSARCNCPARRCCTYSRRRSSAASLPVFGRRASNSAFHCATEARYSNRPPRVAALRRSSREIVDGERPNRRAVSRTPTPCALRIAISSRSENDRYRPLSAARSTHGIPPPSRNHRLPAAPEAPTATPASSLRSPLAISRQNARCTSRRNDGAPGDFIGARPGNSRIHPAGLPINPS